MGETLRINLLKSSYYSLNPPDGRALYLTNQYGKVEEESLIASSLLDSRIPYPLLNPLQTVFYKFYEKGNALVASPTSSGKSLIAYLFMKKYEGRVVYTAPTRSLVKEKFLEFKVYYPKEVDIRTGETILENFKESTAKLIVSTYEYLAYAFRNQSSWLRELSAIVIDEVHQITKRWILEEIITACLRKDIPILCLSATLPGLTELAKWIKADLLIESAWRPVPLYREVRRLKDFDAMVKADRGEEMIASRLLSAAFELRKQEESLILFVPKKSLGWKILELASEERIGIMNQTLPFNIEEGREPEIAFHNADVPKEEREEIEKAFRDGRLKILVATQTLAYGVNLPADRVIIFTKFFRKGKELKCIPDTLDILQMEGRAGRFGIRNVGYSNILVYGVEEERVRKELEGALKKPFTTAITEEGTMDALALFLLLAYMYEGKNPENYLRDTYSFKRISKEKIKEVEDFLREMGYIKGDKLTEKGFFCIRSGIPPTRFEEFLYRTKLSIPLMAIIRPLLHTKKLDGLFDFLERNKRFQEDLLEIKAMLYPCGRRCEEDNTHQFLFYVEGLTARYPNIKNPPGEFSYLATDALHLLRTLMEINREGFYRFSEENMLRIVHSVKYGIDPEYTSLSGVKGIGHIRANLLKEVFKDSQLKPPKFCSPIEDLLEIMNSQKLYDLLREKIEYYRGLGKDKAEGEVKRIKDLLHKNRGGYIIDDRVLLAFWLFEEGPAAMKRKKRELVIRLADRIDRGWN